MFGSESSSLSLVSRCGATAEWVADGEDSETTESVECEEDEDGEGHQAVHHLSLQPPQVQLSDGHGGVEVRHPAGELLSNLAIGLKKF